MPTGVIQNDSSEGVWFLAAGDPFLNYRVEKVSTEDHGEIVLVCGRTRISLKPTPDFSLIPLQGAAATPPATTPTPRPGMGPGGIEARDGAGARRHGTGAGWHVPRRNGTWHAARHESGRLRVGSLAG